MNYLSVPILSAILAQAAVIYCQRRKPDEFLSLKDMFAIADRGWTNPWVVWNSLRTRPAKLRALGRKTRARFLVPAACLILLGAIQQPLYQILVRVGTAAVITCECVPAWHAHGTCPTSPDPGSFSSGTELYEEIGRDLEPGTMAIVEHLPMLSRVISGLASLSDTESQFRLWSLDAAYTEADKWSGWGIPDDSLFHWLFWRRTRLDTDPYPDFFVAGIPRGTTTGVLRQPVMRLNSSVVCDEVDPKDFPSPCLGDQPLTVSWQGVFEKNVRICVPGNYTAFPWTPSRDRQDLVEEIYINVNHTSIANSYRRQVDPLFNASYSIRCTATTTRGYFELGNYHNNNTYGPLLEQWPDTEQMAVAFNNGNHWRYLRWGTPDTPPLYVDNADPSTWKVPGPLMTSALALFGRGSWLSSAANYVSNASSNVTGHNGDYKDASWHLFCHGMPFLNLGLLFDKTNLSSLNEDLHKRELVRTGGFANACDLADLAIPSGKEARERHMRLASQHLLAAFAPSDVAETYINPETMLTAAMFVANEAFLTTLLSEAKEEQAPPGGRIIYTSPGFAMQKPFLSKLALIVLSFSIGLQLLGLGYLAYYIYRAPTWSGQLDAMAMARIGASLYNRGLLPAIGAVSKEDIAGLKTVGGLIGIVEKTSRRRSSITRFVLPKLAATGGLEVESQWLDTDGENREFSITRSVSPELATTDESNAELHRLYMIDEVRGSFLDSQRRESSVNRSLEIQRMDSAGEPCESHEDAELEQLTSTEELRGSFEDSNMGIELGIDAPGPILAADVPRQNPFAPGLKRVWKAVQPTKRPQNVRSRRFYEPFSRSANQNTGLHTPNEACNRPSSSP